MSDHQKPPNNSRASKVYSALQGDDEFSVFSVDPNSRKPPMVDLNLNENVAPVATPLSRSIVRLFRKIFGE